MVEEPFGLSSSQMPAFFRPLVPPISMSMDLVPIVIVGWVLFPILLTGA